jgi:hypothetical protein
LQPKCKFVERALGKLEKVKGGMVVVFYRDGALHLDGLVCHQTTSFPMGVVRVEDDDEVLDCFSPFIAGFVMQDLDVDKAVRADWRTVCRALGRREETHPRHLTFSSPEIMVAYTQSATTLPELTVQVPSSKNRIIKNRQARLHSPASIVRPKEIQHIQRCIQWALKHRATLTVVGGSHSSHCVQPNVVAVDMSAFHQIHILTGEANSGDSNSVCGSLVVAEAGCTTGDIITKTMAAGVTVPLGSRPSVGAGLWLQGGIGHLARLHGLACDAIVGAVVVSVVSSQILCVGYVPSQHLPVGAIRPGNENDILWAIKGAGTNCGIVVSVTFKAHTAPTYLVRNWIVPLSDRLEARAKICEFDKLVARRLHRNCSADAYLYWDAGQLRLGVTMFESSTNSSAFANPSSTPVSTVLGVEDNFAAMDGVDLFKAEMYMSVIHGGHTGGKTSSFKRCLFLKNIGDGKVAECLVAALENRPSPLCYLHLLHGGGAVGDVAADATAFGCRDWDFACVITGVWPRDQNETGVTKMAINWVYKVVEDLLPLSSGVYGADLGPDPRDAALAVKAFGPNRPRLAQLKHNLDPHNVLAYACPLPKASMVPKLIILVTGESCAGKDYCASIWVSVFIGCGLKSRVVSISDATKQQYSMATGANLHRLLFDRAYKEEHRPALTAFFKAQVQQQPRLPEDHFETIVHSAADLDVLLITGMRDEAPVAAFSHLVPNSRLLEVYVQASEQTQQSRRECHGECNNDSNRSGSNWKALDHHPSLIFNNEIPGEEAAKEFAQDHLLQFVHRDLQRLEGMVHETPDFPRPNITSCARHIPTAGWAGPVHVSSAKPLHR